MSGGAELRAPRLAALGAAALALTIAIPLLVARLAGAQALTGLEPGGAMMSALTALVLSLLAAAVAATALRSGSRTGSPAAAAAALLALVLSALRLADHAFSWGLRFDGLLVAPAGPVMSPATALAATLLGAAATAAARHRAGPAFQGLALAALCVGWLGLSRHLFGGEPLSVYAALSLPTALCVAALSVGVLAARPDAGIVALLASESAGGLLARRLLPAAVFVPLVVAWLRLWAQRAGWFGTEAGLSLYAITNVAVFAGLTWAGARLLDRADLERRRRAEEAQAGQQLLQAIVDNSAAVIYAKDLQGRYLLVNRLYGEIFHLEPSAVIGRTDHDIFARDAADAFRDMDRRVAAAGRALTEEETAPQEDGPHTYVSVKCPLRDVEGRIVGVFGISTDITERQRAERERRASEARTHAIIANALDAVVTMDAGGTIVDWNAQAEATFGWTHAEAVGRPLADTIVPPANRAAHRAGLARYLAGGTPAVLNRRIELSALHRDGREFPVELSVTPIEAGEGVAFSAFVRDISERKAAETRLTEQLARLRLLDEITTAMASVRTCAASTRWPCAVWRNGCRWTSAACAATTRRCRR
jgi:PAS domain S-box-containing protein